MGETNENYAAGHAAFASGVPLSLGLEGWTKEHAEFADGWLTAMREWNESERPTQSRKETR